MRRRVPLLVAVATIACAGCQVRFRADELVDQQAVWSIDAGRVNRWRSEFRLDAGPDRGATPIDAATITERPDLVLYDRIVGIAEPLTGQAPWRLSLTWTLIPDAETRWRQPDGLPMEDPTADADRER